MPKKPTTTKAKKAAPVKKTAAKKAAVKKVAKKAPAKKAATKKVAKKVAKKAPAKKAAAKKVAKKAPAKKAAVKKVAKKAPAKKAARKQKIVTRVIAKVDAGFGNQIYIRGNSTGLTWDAGILMKNVSADEWVWESTVVTSEVEFKVLINDSVWSIGANGVVFPGATVVFEPVF
ncbi:MAG: hypothetical protein AB3N33_12140 [Puniceicoccaceae bacterium]